VILVVYLSLPFISTLALCKANLLSVFKEKFLSVFHSVAVKAVTTSSTSKQTMFPASLLLLLAAVSCKFFWMWGWNEMMAKKIKSYL
jgi:hypothetical protein